MSKPTYEELEAENIRLKERIKEVEHTSLEIFGNMGKVLSQIGTVKKLIRKG